MSIQTHYYTNTRHISSPSLVIKTQDELTAQSDTFRKAQGSTTEFEIIEKVYSIIRNIRDAEHPYTLEQLDMVNQNDIQVEIKPYHKHVKVAWKPSSLTCRFATQIGLAIRLKLEKELTPSEKYKLHLMIKEGGHRQQKIIDKQINDKERIMAAKENEELMAFIESLIS